LKQRDDVSKQIPPARDPGNFFDEPFHKTSPISLSEQLPCKSDANLHISERIGGNGESDEMNFEPGYVETDAPGAIFPMIRAGDSVLEYSHVLERRAQKPIGNLRGTSRILEIREFTFTKQRQDSNFSRLPLKPILAHF
jgi:hypothetical protein